MSKYIKTKAIFSWSGDKDTKQIGFMEGDVIIILDIINEDQYYGQHVRTNLKGYFPSKYVAYQPNSRDSDTSTLTSNSNTPSPIRPPPKSSSMSSIHIPLPNSQSSSNHSKNASYASIFTLKRRDKSSSSTLNSEMGSVPPSSTITTPSPPVHQNSTQLYLNSLKSSVSENNLSSKDNGFGTSYVQQLLDSTSSSKTGTSSTFGHSDFSATSAGSFMRHKQESEYQSQYSKSSNDALSQLVERNDMKKSGFLRSLNFFGNSGLKNDLVDDMLLLSVNNKSGEIDSNPNSFSNSSMEHLRTGYNTKIDELNRSKSISGSERGRRSKRVLMDHPDLILRPHDYISNVNSELKTSSAQSTINTIDSHNFDRVDKFIVALEKNFDSKLSPQTITNHIIMKKFNDRLDILRAIYIYLITRFTIIQQPNEKMSPKKMTEYFKIPSIIESHTCTAHQLTWLFLIMADTAGFKVNMILGYLKHPFELNETITDSKKRMFINHSWISLEIKNEVRLIDIALGNPTNQMSKEIPGLWDLNGSVNFYFLAKPFEILHTHTPRYIDQQFIAPPIDIIVQLSLPPLYPTAVINDIKFHNFNSSLFYLNDYETYEFEIEIPKGFQVDCKFKPFDSSFDTQSSLTQIEIKNGKRIAHFQGVLSPRCPAGFIYVTGRPEFTKKSHILLSIPCFHHGKWKELEWVKRVNGLPDVDVYIKTPKLYNLSVGKQLFDIKIFGSTNWINEVKNMYNGVLKVGLFTPNRNIIELDIIDGRYKGKINLEITGIWRLGVIDLEQIHWKVIAEWRVQ